MVRKNKNKWFIKKRGSYLPNNAQGWFTYIPFLGYFLLTALVSYRLSSSIFTVGLLVLPQWIAATIIMTWIAEHKS